jgi:hypothetical protein
MGLCDGVSRAQFAGSREWDFWGLINLGSMFLVCRCWCRSLFMHPSPYIHTYIHTVCTPTVHYLLCAQSGQLHTGRWSGSRRAQCDGIGNQSCGMGWVHSGFDPSAACFRLALVLSLSSSDLQYHCAVCLRGLDYSCGVGGTARKVSRTQWRRGNRGNDAVGSSLSLLVAVSGTWRLGSFFCCSHCGTACGDVVLACWGNRGGDQRLR